LEEPEDNPLTRELPEVNRKLEYRSQETLAFAKASEDKLEKWSGGRMGKPEYSRRRPRLTALVELTRLRRRQPEAGKRRIPLTGVNANVNLIRASKYHFLHD
jgi:hypothetical protein